MRHTMIAGFAAAALATGVAVYFAATKGTEEKVHRVGILFGIDPLSMMVDGFKAKMTELGYREGANIVYDVRMTDFQRDTMRRILQKFIDDDVDAIFAGPTECALAAREAVQGSAVPLVFAYAMIEGTDLVESVSFPGRNTTGVRETPVDIAVKRLELLHEAVPRAKRVYIAYQSDAPSMPLVLDGLRDMAPLLDITLVESPVATVEELKSDFKARAASDDIGMDAILTTGEPVSVSLPGIEAICTFAAGHRIPVGGIGKYSINEEWGAKAIIFSYESRLDEVGMMGALLADKIFNGTPAGAIPVISPEAKLLINYKLMKELGLEASQGLLRRADEIIR